MPLIVSRRKHLLFRKGKRGIRRGSPSAIAETGLQIVGATGHFPNDVLDISAGTKTMAQCRWPFRLGGDCSYLVFAFDNNRIGAAGVAADAGQALTIVQCAIEQDNPAQTVAVKFGGQTSQVLSAGANNIQSDTIMPGSFGLTKFSADAKYWVRIKISVASATEFLIGPVVNSVTGAKFVYYDPSNDNDTILNTGALPNPTGSTGNNYGYGPSAILGQYIDRNSPAVIAVGDSLTYGNAESSGWPMTGLGFFSRAVMDSNEENVFASMKIAKGGSTLANLLAHTKMQTYFQYANVVSIFLGTNDIGTAGTGNLTTLIANFRSLCATARTSRVRKIFGVELWPRATSANGFIDPDDQVYVTDWGLGGKSEYFNASLRSMVGSDINGTFDATVLRRSENALHWAVGVTTDDTHPNSAGHPLAAAEYRTDILQKLGL